MRPLSLVKYQPERSRAYLGSPSVVRLPDGALIVTHDYYGTGCPRNHEFEESLTSVYRSEDDGLTWVNITHIMNCYWSTLFLHEGALWILGTSQQYGSILHPPLGRRRFHLDASRRREDRHPLPRVATITTARTTIARRLPSPCMAAAFGRPSKTARPASGARASRLA